MKPADIILQQMGGASRLRIMIGAEHFLSEGDRTLTFKFKGSKVANYIKITLTGRDDYNIEFGKIWGGKYKVVKTLEGIYADQLKKVFETTTGLYLSL